MTQCLSAFSHAAIKPFHLAGSCLRFSVVSWWFVRNLLVISCSSLGGLLVASSWSPRGVSWLDVVVVLILAGGSGASGCHGRRGALSLSMLAKS